MIFVHKIRAPAPEFSSFWWEKDHRRQSAAKSITNQCSVSVCGWRGWEIGRGLVGKQAAWWCITMENVSLSLFCHNYYEKLLHLWDWNTSTHFTMSLGPRSLSLLHSPLQPQCSVFLYSTYHHHHHHRTSTISPTFFFSSFLLSANSSLPNLKSIWYGVWPLASQLPLEQLWHTQPLLCLI